jgi:hypothetical protein
MHCSRVRELLPDYSVELLGAAAQRAVDAHLALCDGCRRELRALDATMELVADQGFREPPAGLFNALRNRIEAGELVQERQPWWGFFSRKPVRVLAMGFAMATVAVAFLLPIAQGPGLPPSPGLHPAGVMGAASARGPLANSIRAHAQAAAESPLADRVALEAMAQLAAPERDEASGDKQ